MSGKVRQSETDALTTEPRRQEEDKDKTRVKSE